MGRSSGDGPLSGEVLHQEQRNGIEVILRHPAGVFRSGANEFGLQIRDVTTGEPVSASNVGIGLFMPAMANMQAMTATARDFAPAGPGEWTGMIDVPMAGEWQVTVDVESPAGISEIRFSTVAR